MKCSLDISSFPKSLVSHSVVSSTSLHCSSKKAFLPLLGILWNSAFCWVYLSLSPLLFTSVFFSAICKASSDNHFAFLDFFFFRMVLVTTSCTMFLHLFVYCNGECSLLPPFYFIHFFIYQYVLINSFFFFLLFSIFWCLNCLRVGHGRPLPSDSCVLLSFLHHFCEFSYFFTEQDVLVSYHTCTVFLIFFICVVS